MKKWVNFGEWVPLMKWENNEVKIGGKAQLKRR
jgi:hypothetical protein